MKIVVIQDRALSDYAERLGKLAAQGSVILAETLNAVGGEIRKATVAAETAQTGLKQDVINRAQQVIDATPGRLSFTITARGGNVRLKYFGPSEGGGGVTARPWNRSTFYGGAFLTSGRAGIRRVSPKLNGQVYENIQGGKWGGKIRQVRSGLFIPKEMVTGSTASTFDVEAATVVAPRIISRLGSLLP